MNDFAEIILGITNRAVESHQGVGKRGHDNAGEALWSHSAAKVTVPQGEKAVSEWLRRQNKRHGKTNDKGTKTY